MTKREHLHQWLLKHGYWAYLSEVPYANMGMSAASCSSALQDLCRQGRADFRIIGLKQYRANDVPAIKRGPKPPKELK